jgi:hypothetical protein
MIAEDIASRADAKKTGTGWQAKCPAHDDKSPSLSITQEGNKVLLKCHAGCATADVVAGLGITMADLFTDSRAMSRKPEIVATYDYTDEAGALLFQVCRFIPKDFRQRKPDSTSLDGWTWSTKGVRRVLYGLPKIIDAVKRGLPILICEGEKDVHAAEKHGFIATCNPGGAGKWEDGYTESLRGADVVIVPDNDEPGRKHAELVASNLKGIAKSVRTLKLPIGKDLYDFFANGGTPEQLIQLIDRAKPCRTFAEQVEDRRWNPNLIPPAIRPVYSIGAVPIATPGNLQSISAHAKTGKSAFINAMLAAPMALDGSDTFGLVSANAEGKAVLHIDTEQSLEDFWHQVRRAIRRAGLDNPPAWLAPYCFTGFDAKHARLALTIAAEQAAQHFGGIHSIHLDGVADLVCDVNDSEECNAFVAELHAMAIQYDCPIVGVIHFNPSNDKTRGHLGSQLERKAETNLRLDKEGEVTDVWSEKQRRAPILKGTGPRFKWSDEAGMHVSCESKASARDSAKVQKLIFERDEAFGDRPAMRYNELVSTLMEVLRVSDKTAERRVDAFRHCGIIQKAVPNVWIKKDLQ